MSFHARHRVSSRILVEIVGQESVSASVGDRRAPSPGLPAKTPAGCSTVEGPTAEWRERLFTAKYPRNRSSPRPRRRRSTGYPLSVLSQAFPRFRSALLPYRSAMLGGVGEQSESLLVFLLSLPLPSLPFSRPFLSKRRRIPGPFNPGLLKARGSRGDGGATDTTLRRQHSRIMQFSDVLI